MDGYFVGDFFGLEHEWNTIADSGKSFFLKEEVQALFRNFEILGGIKERKYFERETRWHRYEIIAKKRANI